MVANRGRGVAPTANAGRMSARETRLTAVSSAFSALPPHAVAEGPGFDEPLHGVDHDQHGEDDELDEHEVGREVVA
ncbi:MAG: hypothetical protein AUJ00_03815 [Gemmatimonadetes bacterium 13_1_40CM_3_70_6]|nr:MAG: hypothetical protein AUJ00_03815 [Gemmatimonadetes bacterium 13_1_40CM_3_70_6]